MKHLIKNTKEFIITILVFITIAFILYDGFKEGTPIDNVIESVIIILGWYYNMPTSEENCLATGRMRAEKEQKKDGYVGECFTDEVEEVGEEDA